MRLFVAFKHRLARLWYQAWSLILVEMTDQEIAWLARPRDHISLLAARRASMIISRVRLMAGLFAVLTPLWMVVDIWAFPKEVWWGLCVVRIAASAAFAFVLITLRGGCDIRRAYKSLGFLLGIPTGFYFFTYLHMSQFELEGLQEAFSVGYAYLPFVMLAGLSIFPLTMVESLVFAAPMLLIQAGAAAAKWPILNWPTFAASFWLLLLIGAVSLMAGVSQLAFMIVLVREAIRDGMTGCFSRNSGEELLELQYVISARSGNPLTLAFIDLDHFKEVNDTFGHDAGDKVLVEASNAIREKLRTGDMLTRWGGEEFVLIMPNTSADMACIALERIMANGLTCRPDGVPVTASIGLAERIKDTTENWQKLVEIADQRMYQAKVGGRNRIVGCPQPDPAA